MMPDNAGNAQVLGEIMQLLGPASRTGARVGGPPTEAQRNLLDVVDLTITTAEQRGNAGATYRAVRDVPVSTRDNPHSDVSLPPIYPKRREASSPLAPRTANRGLRATGAVPIPAEMWQRHAPTNWTWVAASMPPVGATAGQPVTALARKMPLVRV